MAETPGDARLEQLERRVHNDPMSVAFAALAEEYRRAGRFAEAIETCRAGLTRHPAYLSARVTLGRALMEKGALEEAEAELQRVVAAAPENLAAIRCLAEIHHRRGGHPEAEEHYRSALEAASQSASLSGSGEQAASAAGAEPPPADLPLIETAPSAEEPTLAGLERLLAAILAARDEGDEARSQ